MDRQQVIGLIAAQQMKDMPAEKRRELIQVLFIFDHDMHDALIASFPISLQEELCSGKRQYDYAHCRYDPIVIKECEAKLYGARNSYVLKKVQAIHTGVTHIDGEAETLLPCPCCGYQTLEARNDYEICGVCFWEDDGANQEDDYSGPNHMTLGQGRQNVAKFGACSKDMVKNVEPEGRLKYHRHEQ